MRMTRVAVTASVLSLLAMGMVQPAPAQQNRQGPSAEERAERERELQEQLAKPRPIAAVNSVWINKLTWMEVRDAIDAGKTTAIVSTGGIEQNGPYVVTGKHNVVLRGMCEAIARKLGNALCAPVIKLVPEGGIQEKTGHMRFPGTISLRQETFRMVLDDVASSLKAHGFTDIILIGDSGGNQDGLRETAAALNERWADASARAYYIPEFYEYADVEQYMEQELGVVQPIDEGLHDNFYITSIMMAVDPTAVRYDQRVEAGLASINGVSIAPKEKSIEVGNQLMDYRAEQTVAAIRAAMSSMSADQRQ